MNFLEQLAAEWYEYNDYFVLTNRTYGKRGKGGFEGEVDVLAFRLKEKERDFLHIETSTDASSYAVRKEKFRDQFAKAARYYRTWLPCKPSEVRKIAIVGWAKEPTVDKNYFGNGIEMQTIPQFIAQIAEELADKRPTEAAVPEGFPLVCAIQFAVHYGRSGV
ncbi:MAG: hypothetical protein KAW89_08565 [Armatimonadetes bacterium]|nr:hypothetical protein [Armatimonadota bacterium]